VGPKTACGEGRVQQPGACHTAPLDVAKRRYPGLAKELGRYEFEREVKDATLEAGGEASFFLNSGDCFAVLAEPLAPKGQADLGYALRIIRGTAQPGDQVAPARPGTGGRDGRAQLSPEFCPWEHQPLAIWNAAPKSSAGPFRLHLLRRVHPDPTTLAKEAQAARPSTPSRPRGGGGGGSCSSFECGEDCGSELRACELDCFRYGSHEKTAAATCKSVCKQIARACERSCAVPCP
jgi:hypothetical protein